MTWALYELMANQSLMKEVTVESESVFGKERDWSTDMELPSRDKVAELICVEGCLKVRK